MTLQYSDTLRNNQLAQIEATIGSSPVLRMMSGAKPASVGAAQTGTVIAEITLPVDWMDVPSAGLVSKLGTWQDVSANADGILGYFRIYNSTVSTCHMQGTITLTGGGGDMTVDNTNVLTGQTINITTFSIGAGNA